MEVDVIEAARQPLLAAAADIHGALVYLDAGASEVVQLTLGPAFLFGLGAANVCDLARAHPDDALPALLHGQPPTALVVLTTQLLPDTHQHVLQLLMVHPQARRCVLFCSVSELAHAQLDLSLSTLGVEAYSEYASELRQALAQQRAAAGLPAPREDLLQLAVRHLPLHVAALDTNTFVLPAGSAAASRAFAGGRAAGFAGTDVASQDTDDSALGVSTGLSLLPHALADLSRVLGARLEPFALGPVSAAVAKELVALPQAGQRSGGLDASDSPRAGGGGAPGSGGASGGGSIALVLVDRSLDLATPCMHAEHVLDMLLEVLPRADLLLPHGTQAAAPYVCLRPADLRVDVPQLAPLHPLPPPPAADTQQQPDRSVPAAGASGAQPGSSDDGRDGDDAAAAAQGGGGQPLCEVMGLSLFHPADRRWLGWLQQLWPKQHKEVLLMLRKWLKEALRGEKISPPRSKLSSAVSAAELTGLAQCLMAQPGVFLRHQPIVGLALAAAAALGGDPPAGGQLAPLSVWERLAGYERQLLLALPEGSEGAGMLLPMLLEAIRSTQPDQARLCISHTLQLLVATYSLSGDRLPPAPPLYSADEAQLREALADAVMAAAQQAARGSDSGGQPQPCPQAVQQVLSQLSCLPQAQRLLHEALHSGRVASDPAGVRQQLCQQLVDVFQRLRWLAAARGKLKDVRRLMQADADTGVASSVSPLLRQVLTKILVQADNRDLQQPEAASLVGSLLPRSLGAGLGRLGFGGMSAPARRPRVSDFPAVLLFVVGGICAAEARELAQDLEQHVYGHKPLVLLGGTTLLGGADAARLFLGA